MFMQIWHSDRYPKRAKILTELLTMMSKRLVVGATRHQLSRDEFGSPEQDYLKRLHETLRDYELTGNCEKLIDTANYCLLEAKNSLHPEAHWNCADSGGRVNLQGERFT